jgi:hypothetical protein
MKPTLSLPIWGILGYQAFLPHRRLTLLQFDEFVFLGFPNSGSGEKGLKLKVTKAAKSKSYPFRQFAISFSMVCDTISLHEPFRCLLR